MGSWAIQSGTWNVSGGVLNTTSSSAEIRYESEHPDGVASHVVVVNVRSTADEDRIRVIFGDFAVELEVATDGEGYLRVYDTGGMIQQQPVSGATLNVWHTLKACYHYGDDEADENLSGFFTGGVTGSGNISTGTLTGSGSLKIALGTGTGTSGTISFDNVDWDRHKAEGWKKCEDCGFDCVCGWCTSDTPCAITVEVSGIANDACADCGDLNGSYVLDWVSGCKWQYEMESPVCAHYAWVSFRLESSIISPDMWVLFGNDPDDLFVAYRIVFSKNPGDFDCENWDGLPLTSKIVTYSMCDLTSATCTITAS